MALENSDLLVVQKSGGGELRKTSVQSLLAQGDALWTKDATKIHPKLNNESVVIGGTLPNTPAIYLAADGSASFKSDVVIGADPTDPTISLNASGSASFEGKVGIGTTSPSTVFHVVGANSNDATTLATAASDAKIRLQKSDISGLSKFQGTTDTGTCWYSQIANGNGSTAYNHVINPFGGNVGIGTTSPSQLLDVNGSATFAGDVTITDGTNSRHEIKVLDVNGATGALHDFKSASGFPGANSAIRVILGNDQNIKLAYDGSATFAGDIGIGGTLPSDPNISLDASGAMSGRSLSVNENSAISAISSTNRSDSNKETFKVTGSGGVYIGTNIVDSGANITLNANGSAEYKAQVTVSRTDNLGAYAVRKNGTLTGRWYGDGKLSIGGNQDPDPAEGNINLNADGSAEFSDVVNIGSWSSSDPAFSARLGGTNNFKFRANLSTPDSKIVDFHNNGSTDNEVVASISASGAGNFLGGVTVGGNGATQYKGSWISDGTLRIGGTLPSAPNISLNANGTVEGLRFIADQTSSQGYTYLSQLNGVVKTRIDIEGIKVGGSLDSGNSASQAPNISLNADGTARFTGRIFPESASLNYKQGKTGQVFGVYEGLDTDSAAKIQFDNDGSATFAGDVTANNVTFDVGTADEVNVRERLVEARQTFTELKAAVNSATDFDDLKSALLSALSQYE